MRLNKTLTYCIIEDVEDVILGIQKRMKKFGKWENVGNSREITLAKEKVKKVTSRILFILRGIKKMNQKFLKKSSMIILSTII